MTTPQNVQNWLPTSPKLDWRLWADPDHVVSNPAMTIQEKRELLASWASDVRAVPDYPALRKLESGHLVTIDAVLNALKRLDGTQEPSRPAAQPGVAPRRGHWSRISRLWRRHSSDDDDDDPSSPAPAGIMPRPPVFDGAAVAA